VGNINKALDSDSAALLAGITVGDRSGFSKEFKNDMALSGTTHIVALSGYNISILAITISYIFGSFLSKQKSFYFTVGVIVLFVLMTGAEASVVRAAIMGSLALLAERAGRLYSFRNALTLAAFGMTLWNPHVLLSDVGFQLSFGALMGIVYIKPIFEKILGLKKNDEGFLGWKGNALATFSAQLAVVPVLLYNFGSLNIFSLFANVLILGLQPYTMALGFATGFVGFASSILAHVFGWLVAPLLLYQVAVIQFFANFPLTLQTSVFPFALWLIYYSVLAFLLFSFRHLRLFRKQVV
jgi:competence protein ComEC